MLKFPARITPITNKRGRNNFLSNVILYFENEKSKLANKEPNNQGRGSFV